MKRKIVISSIVCLIIGLVVGGGIGYVGYSNQKELAKMNKPTMSQETILAYDWLIYSGEAMANKQQAYNSAIKQLPALMQEKSTKPKAVVLDIDETCLNNAPGNGYQLANNTSFSQDIWNKWVFAAEATPIQGAVEFTKAASSAGAQVFYVSNRTGDKLDATVKNLAKYGFADSTKAGHVILNTTNAPNKVSRFEALEQSYDVVMYVGDQITDLGPHFLGESLDEVRDKVELYKNDFGTRLIQIPNPTYGVFTTYLFGKDKTDEEQVEISKEYIQSFDPQTGKLIENKVASNLAA